MKKVLLTATVQSHICQFHIPLIKRLKEQGYEVHVAAKNNLDLKPGLNLDCADVVFDIPFSRSPFSLSNIKAYIELDKVVKQNKYDIIHCNTPMGSVVTRLTASKKNKVIYTAHGFHFYKGAPIRNWLFYFPVEWFLSFKTDVLICINNEDYKFAKKHLHAKSVKFTHGVGFDSKRFNIETSKENAKKDLKINDEIVLLSVGDLCERKNHKVLLYALKRMETQKVHLYIAGYDQLDGQLHRLAENLGVSDKVSFLGYTRQLSKYFNAADIFLFPSLQEGLPIALIEAMSWGLPVIASNIRGNVDLIKDGDGGYLVDTDDFLAIAEKTLLLAGNAKLRNSFANRNKFTSFQYEVESVMDEIKDVYSSVL